MPTHGSSSIRATSRSSQPASTTTSSWRRAKYFPRATERASCKPPGSPRLTREWTMRTPAAMLSTRSAVRGPPLFTITSSNATAGLAAAIASMHSASRSIRFHVTIRIETTGSAIETRHASQFADAPHRLDAVAARGLRWRAAVEMAQEGGELAPERRLVSDVDRARARVGADFDLVVASRVEDRDRAVEGQLDAPPAFGPAGGNLQHARRVRSEPGGNARRCARCALGEGSDRGRNDAEDLAHDGEIVGQERPHRIDVRMR